MHLDRDAGTRMAYVTLATWAFFLYFVGPVTPLIAEQLAVPLQTAGMIGVALAAGLVLSGALGPLLILRVGRTRTAIIAALGLACGTLLLAVVASFPAVLAAVLLASATGSLLMNVAMAALADRHGPAGPRAITEANALAAWVGLTSPLLIGLVVGLGWGWRPASVVIAVVALAVAGILTRVPVPEGPPPDHALSAADTIVAAPQDDTTDAAFPVRFYVSLVAVIAAAGAEISLSFWGGVLIAEHTGTDLAAATAMLSVMIGGIAVGRTAGSGLARRFPVTTLVYASLVVALAGFLVVWITPDVVVAAGGLFLTGLGLALLFPLTSSIALGHGAGRSDRAIAIISVVIGITMGAAPFALGAVAAAVGVTTGFLIVPALLLAGAAALWLAGAPSPSPEPSVTTRHRG